MSELGDISALLQRYYYSGDLEEYYMQPIADGRGGLIVFAGYNGLYVIQDRESFLSRPAEPSGVCRSRVLFIF